MPKTKIFRLMMAAYGFAIALPIVGTLTSRPASASGYILMSGITGEPQCNPGGGDDCPN